MGRPSNTNPLESKQRILDCAYDHFASRGYHGTSMRDLIEASGFSAATINHHFGNKQKLYDAVVDEVYRRLEARANEALVGVDVADVGNMMALLWGIARAERDGVRVLVRQVLDGGRLTAHTEAKHFLPQIEKGSQLMARLTGVTPAQARAAAVTIGYLLSRFVLQDDRSLMAAFGVRSAKEAHARVVAALITTASALFTSKESFR